jgi:signal transduction histidine kinase
LFQKFVTGRLKGVGSGLGLAFCRLVIEAQGGSIGVERGPAGGGSFAFTVPEARPEPSTS